MYLVWVLFMVFFLSRVLVLVPTRFSWGCNWRLCQVVMQLQILASSATSGKGRSGIEEVFLVGVGFSCFMDFCFWVLGFQGDGSQLDRGALVCFSSFFSALHRGIGFRDFSKG